MDTQLFEILNVVVTPWKLVGYLGVFLFAGRWVVQVIATRRRGRPAFPGLFWTMSMAGARCSWPTSSGARTTRSA